MTGGINSAQFFCILICRWVQNRRPAFQSRFKGLCCIPRRRNIGSACANGDTFEPGVAFGRQVPQSGGYAASGSGGAASGEEGENASG